MRTGKCFSERLSLLNMGLEDRMKQPVGLLLRRAATGADTSDGRHSSWPKILLLDEHTAALDPATAEKVLALTKKTVEENHLACLMITHNMHSALEMGNRTMMMDSGKIVLDISGEERAGLTVDGLLEKFSAGAGKELDNDRILFSKVE